MTTEEHYQTLLVVWDPFQNIPVVVYILMHTWGGKVKQTSLKQPQRGTIIPNQQ